MKGIFCEIFLISLILLKIGNSKGSEWVGKFKFSPRGSGWNFGASLTVYSADESFHLHGRVFAMKVMLVGQCDH